MAYQITCDGYILDDPRDDELTVLNPKCNLESNKVGEASFSIALSHPHFDKLRKKRSIFEIRQDGEPIFRGRMTEAAEDIENTRFVDLEGVLAFTNDSFIPPFKYPDDDLSASIYFSIAEAFLSWVLSQHNSQVEPWQRLKVGNVTVHHPKDTFTRSSDSYMSTWEVLKTMLFDSDLGGYLCIRYEDDGNYIDYHKAFEYTNAQKIVFGENLLDITSESDFTGTYSAILPLGAEKNGKRLTIESLEDTDIGLDLVKQGKFIYSRSAREEYGWCCVPVKYATWDNITNAEDLKEKAMSCLISGLSYSNTITIKAVDLHFSDAEIESFRVYRNVLIQSKPHGQEETLGLTRLEIDIHNPQNTVITIGDTVRTLIDINSGLQHAFDSRVGVVTGQILEEVDTAFGENETVVLQKVDELYNTKIEQLSKSITLELSGSLGNKASIKLAIGGKEYMDEIELTKVREAFANDNTSAVISAGVITFNSGTIVINSNNFKVDADGVIEATSGTIGGWTLKSYKLYAGDGVNVKTVCVQAPTANNLYVFAAGGTSHDSYADCPFRVTKAGKLYATDAIIHGDVVTIDGSFKTQLDRGSMRLYYNDVLCGTINTKYWSGASTEGISLRVEEGGNYIMFSHADDTQGSGYTVDYYLNAGWSSNYDEMHIFQTSARFLSDAYFAGKTRIRSLRLFDADGEYLVGINNGQLTVSKL